MIYLGNVREMENDMMNYVIVRRPKNINFYRGERLWVPELSPSNELLIDFKSKTKQGRSEKDIFEKDYIPTFINEVATGIADNAPIKEKINKLYYDSFKRDIRLICFCVNEDHCHRSIIAGILKGAGAKVNCDSKYLKYYDMYLEERENIRKEREDEINLD